MHVHIFVVFLKKCARMQIPIFFLAFCAKLFFLTGRFDPHPFIQGSRPPPSFGTLPARFTPRVERKSLKSHAPAP